MSGGYVYIKSEPGIFTVGFYDPAGTWHSESDHGSSDEAARRVAWLNGSGDGMTERQRELWRGALASRR